MPQIHHYEAEVTLRFALQGPISPAEAAKAAEERASKALDGDVPPYHDPVQNARIASIAVSDTSVRPLRATGGRR